MKFINIYVKLNNLLIEMFEFLRWGYFRREHTHVCRNVCKNPGIRMPTEELFSSGSCTYRYILHSPEFVGYFEVGCTVHRSHFLHFAKVFLFVLDI